MCLGCRCFDCVSIMFIAHILKVLRFASLRSLLFLRGTSGVVRIVTRMTLRRIRLMFINVYYTAHNSAYTPILDVTLPPVAWIIALDSDGSLVRSGTPPVNAFQQHRVVGVTSRLRSKPPPWAGRGQRV